MAHIALVQNQSEMANYSHADCRSMLRSFGHSHELFTASNIGQLTHGVTAGDYDCLIVASNALHDNVIRDFFSSKTGVGIVETLLSQTCGILILMQYKAAYDDYSFEFLPDPLKKLKAIARPASETAQVSELVSTNQVYAPPLLGYPSEVKVSKLQSVGKNHKTLKGVYWHYWGGEIEPFWDVLLSCASDKEKSRPLILSAKENFGKRIVVSALPIDWHAHVELFKNVISYVSEGRHLTAVVKSSNISSPAFDYFVATLRARKEGFRIYSTDPKQLDTLLENVGRGTHRTLVLGPTVAEAAAIDENDVRLKQKMNDGALKIIAFGDSIKGQDLIVSGRQNPATDIYRLLVPEVARDLQSGYLDGSFWSTVTGLKALERLPAGLDDQIFPLEQVRELVLKHDRNGSYDEVFGATVALLWLAKKTAGASGINIDNTLHWLRERMPDMDEEEKIRALTVFSNVGVISSGEVAELERLVSQFRVQMSSEFQLLTLLEAAVEISSENEIVRFVGELSDRQEAGANENGLWVDIPTTAGLVSELVRAHEIVSAGKEGNPATVDAIRDIVIPAMISLEDAFQRSIVAVSGSESQLYPWDGKAATCLRCLAAWYHFDRFLDAPVTVAADSVHQSASLGRLSVVAENCLETLEFLVAEKSRLVEELEAAKDAFEERDRAKDQARRARRKAGWAVFFSRFFLLAALLQGYIIVDHVIRTKLLGETLAFLDSLSVHTAAHITVITIITALLAVPWSRALGVLNFLMPEDRGSK